MKNGEKKTESKKGLLIVLCGPSGAGKGTVHRRVLELDSNIKPSVSVTTRPKRAGEKDGEHYYFKSPEEYKRMLADDAFLESAVVYKNYYGTPKAPVLKTLEAGKDVMLEIDINGAMQIKSRHPESVLIFLTPPSLERLKNQLINRGTETETSLMLRLGSAKSELGQYGQFDYVVFNDTVIQAAQDILGIIAAEKCRVKFKEAKIKEILKTEI